MLAFVDESGDLGMKLESGSSDYFGVIAVWFPDKDEAQRCDDAIAALRTKIPVLKTEFHFTKLKHYHREQFFDLVKGFDFQYFGVYLDKRKMAEKSLGFPRPFTHMAVQYLFAGMADKLSDVIITIDETGSSEFRKALAKDLPKAVNGNGNPRAIKKVKCARSNGNNLLQMADMVCGAVCRSIGKKQPHPDAYREMIHHKELIVTILP